MKHYLYRHIRLDKNEPFYVGIGTKQRNSHNSFISEYKRGFSKRNRSKYWKNIINKTKYEVEILVESDDYDFIKEKEIEFITLHGRRDLGKGTLVNMTDGGDGIINIIYTEERKRKAVNSRKGYTHSEETRRKISKANKGIKHSAEHMRKLEEGRAKTRSKPILQYGVDGKFIKEWESATEAANYFNTHYCAIRQCTQNKIHTAGGYVWKDKINNFIPQTIECAPKMKSLKKHWDIKERLSRGININNISITLI
ncbi:MAG: hypothetical protein H5T96_09440, partial [Tissierellales bacterium]|nr:hypothetical protein [Tissierellales bacterium]